MNQEKNTAVVTVLGRDRVGIIADVSRLLADYGININDISQTILDDIFTMVMMVDLKDVLFSSALSRLVISCIYYTSGTVKSVL